MPAVKPAHEFATQTRGNALDPARLEPKRARRIIANRQAAHKSRLKKLGQVGVLKQGLAISCQEQYVAMDLAKPGRQPF